MWYKCVTYKGLRQFDTDGTVLECRKEGETIRLSGGTAIPIVGATDEMVVHGTTSAGL